MLREMRREDGFTLSEVLISATIGLLMLTTVFAILDSVTKGYVTQTDQAEAQSTAQINMMRLTKDIRQAEKPLLAVYSVPGYHETLAFKADLNNDGISEAVQYSYSQNTGTFSKQVNTTGEYNFNDSPTNIVASNVRYTTGQTAFTYYGTSLLIPLDPASPSSDIINKAKLIKIRLVIDKDLTKPPAPVDLTSEVKLRNFGY